MLYRMFGGLALSFIFFAPTVYAANVGMQGELSDVPTVVITAEEEPTTEISDPLENVNRGFYQFNEALDNTILEPVARGYGAIMPEWGQTRVSDAMHNLSTPVSFLNSVLQGNVESSFTNFWRFIINSTFGIGGLFDVAQEAGLEPRDEDFGQTLAVWGVGDGAYIVWPFLGPKTARDSVGWVVDTITNPFNYLTPTAVVSLNATDVVSAREELLDITDEIERTSLDPYSTIKSAYIQRRKSEIDNKE